MAEINEKQTKETITKIKKTKSCFFKKINKIHKPENRKGNPLTLLVGMQTSMAIMENSVEIL